MKILVCVDMQRDFCELALANHRAVEIIPLIKKRIVKARQDKEMVIFTQDTHDEDYMNTLEGEKLPVEHCIYGTEGWKIVPELDDEASLCVLKPTFASFNLINRMRTLADAMNEIPEIELCGTVTSVCVLANAVLLRAAFPNSKITVNGKLCADINDENQSAALKIMECQQIDVIY